MLINDDIELDAASITDADISVLDGIICREAERLKLNKEIVEKAIRVTQIRQLSLANELTKLTSILMDFDLSEGTDFFISLGDPEKDALISKYIRRKEFRHDRQLRKINSSSLAVDLGEIISELVSQIKNCDNMYNEYVGVRETLSGVIFGIYNPDTHSQTSLQEIDSSKLDIPATAAELRESECESVAQRV